MLLLHQADLVHGLPASVGMRDALRRDGLFIASFSPFVDETGALADLILPDRVYLEDWGDDIPEPGAMHYSQAIAPLIAQAVKASDGNALVLFTSYSLLETVYKDIYRQLESDDILTLRQGALPRARLLEKFRIVDRSVLFATDSFWEGVDVPGNALRLVIIARLPFRVPTEPIIEARVEHMENQGLNSFIDYSVPVAVLKFKQGFGRLIRTRSDIGAVLVLDKRIISKFYGRYFLESLPDCNQLISGADEIIKEREAFFMEKD